MPVSAFATYDPTQSSGIVAGPLALYQVSVNSIHPTQLNEGLTEVGKKTAGFNLLAPSQLQANLLTDIEPVVIGPGGQLYLTDGHHTFTALENSIYGGSNPTVYVNVIANYSNLTTSQFFTLMQSQNFLLPLNDGVPQTVNPATGAPIPSALTGLTSDPYRGLEYSILKNKNSKLFPTILNITGAIGSATPGLDKMTGYYSDFFEAAAYRNANGGLGLPYLSPGDIALATRWNLNPASQTTLPNVTGTVTAAQLPGFILSSSYAFSGVISNATLANGAVDGNGTFTGITTINAGTAANPITIGTPNTGFVMQLGADLGNNITLSGANTYTGGTSLLAGNLIVANDGALGAAVPAGAVIDPNNVKTSVQAANGIVFNSLTEGNATLTLGTTVGNGTSTFTSARPIAVGGEAATINLNGNQATFGQLFSLGTAGVGIGNATGFSDLTIDDNSSNKGVLTLSTASPNFYGNVIIGNTNKPTVRVMNDAALGNTTGSVYAIGQVELNGGTLQAGASFAAPERNLFLGGGSSFDVNGFATSWGNLTDVQRTLTVLNSNTTTAGVVTFNSLNIGGVNTTSATGATSTLALNGGAAGETVTLTNGVVRTDRSTLLIAPTSAATNVTLGTTEKVLATVAPALTNGIVSPWTIIDLGSSSVQNGAAAGNNRYNFATYNALTGYNVATYTKSGSGSAAGIAVAANTDVVEQTGNATLTASAQAYALKVDSGAVITATGQTITLGNNTGPAGLILSGSSAAINGGTLAFGGSEAVVFVRGTTAVSSLLTGTNGLTLSGSGTLTLSSASSGLSGLINIDSGTLNLTAANALPNVSGLNLADVKSSPSAAILSISASNAFSTLNSAGSNSSINISNGATLTIGDSQNLSSTLSATITQSGAAATALVKAGNGLLDLSGGAINLVSGGGISVTGGQLRVAASEFKGSSPLTNTIALSSGTELQFAQNGGGQFSDAVTGAGALHLIGGTLQLTGANGANTYSGGTIVEAGSTLDLTTNQVSTGNANITNAGGLVVFDQSTSGTYSGVISDGRQMEATTGALLSGSLVKDDSATGSGGNLTLAAVQAYSGGTFVEAGTLTLGVANAIATSSGVDLGRVGGAVCNPSPCSGLTANLALSANNTIQGLMDETNNNTGVQLGSNTLTLNIASGRAFTYNGVISGGGNLVMSGSGTEVLTGTSTYTGTTTVNGGLLSVNGSIATSSLTTVNAGGALGGIGTIGNTSVAGGTLAPGNNSTGLIGTLQVSGNLAFATAAQYLVQVSQTANSQTSVTGTAALAGTVRVVSPSGGYKLNQAYTILSAAGGLGGSTFNSLVLPSFVTGALSYSSTNVSLTLQAAFEQASGLNANQKAIGAAIDRVVNANGALPAGFANLANLSPAALPGALSQLSGEIGTASQQTTFGAMTQFIGSMLDHFNGGDTSSSTSGASQYADPDMANAYASTARPKSERDAYAAVYNKAAPRPAGLFDPRWSVWAAGFGGSQTTDGNVAVGSNGSSSSIYGTAVGADYRISRDTVAGFALAGGGTNFSTGGNLGSGRSDLFQAGAFVKHTAGAAYVAGSLAYGWQDVTTNRTVTALGFDQLRAEFNANAYSGRVEGGYRFVAPWMGSGVGITPYAAGQFTTFNLPAYAEQVLAGAGASALAYAAKSVTDTRSEFGIRTDKSYALTDSLLTLRGRVAWAHDFNTDRSVAATFQALPGASFTVNGATPAADAALTTASAELKWMNGFSVSGVFEGEFSNVTRSYTGKGVVRYAW